MRLQSKCAWLATTEAVIHDSAILLMRLREMIAHVQAALEHSRGLLQSLAPEPERGGSHGCRPHVPERVNGEEAHCRHRVHWRCAAGGHAELSPAATGGAEPAPWQAAENAAPELRTQNEELSLTREDGLIRGSF
jgi:hypothetical protein